MTDTAPSTILHDLCPHCRAAFEPGIAIPTAIHESDEGTRSEAVWSHGAPLIRVWKCPRCGHSITR